jgi:hypothetical protein
MRYIVTMPSTGVNRPPAYDGSIAGVYVDVDDARKAYDLLSGDGRSITILPGRDDVFGDAWAALSRLDAAQIPCVLDSNQHMLVEAMGYEAAVVTGDVTNAPTQAPE